MNQAAVVLPRVSMAWPGLCNLFAVGVLLRVGRDRWFGCWRGFSAQVSSAEDVTHLPYPENRTVRQCLALDPPRIFRGPAAFPGLSRLALLHGPSLVLVEQSRGHLPDSFCVLSSDQGSPEQAQTRGRVDTEGSGRLSGVQNVSLPSGKTD